MGKKSRNKLILTTGILTLSIMLGLSGCKSKEPEVITTPSIEAIQPTEAQTTEEYIKETLGVVVNGTIAVSETLEDDGSADYVDEDVILDVLTDEAINISDTPMPEEVNPVDLESLQQSGYHILDETVEFYHLGYMEYDVAVSEIEATCITCQFNEDIKNEYIAKLNEKPEETSVAETQTQKPVEVAETQTQKPVETKPVEQPTQVQNQPSGETYKGVPIEKFHSAGIYTQEDMDWALSSGFIVTQEQLDNSHIEGGAVSPEDFQGWGQ